MSSPDIFISFASQDIKLASTLCSSLEGRGFKCWISARNILPGENFQVAIVRAIRQAKVMLLVFTSNSNNSEEMNKELALASQNKLIVVPLRLEDVTPNEAFSYEFATRQWIDFFADWELAIQQLSQRLENALKVEAPPAAPEMLTPEAVAAVEMSPQASDVPDYIAAAANLARSAKVRTYAMIGGALALVLLGAGLIAPRLMSAKPADKAETRVMSAVVAPAPAAPLAVAAAPVEVVTATSAAEAPLTPEAAAAQALEKEKRRKARAARAAQSAADVPY
jgi:TIR domain